MIKIIHPERVPNGGGFVYVQPESGLEFKHARMEYLIAQIKKHRLANNYPIGTNFEQEIEAAVCNRNPELCKDMAMQPTVQLGLADILRGTRVIGEFVAKGMPFVSDTEADRRAATCSNCTFNMDYHKPCAACGGLAELVTGIVGGRKTKYDGKLKACNVCHCANAAQIHIPLEILRKGVTSEMDTNWPENCWKKPS